MLYKVKSDVGILLPFLGLSLWLLGLFDQPNFMSDLDVQIPTAFGMIWFDFPEFDSLSSFLICLLLLIRV